MIPADDRPAIDKCLACSSELPSWWFASLVAGKHRKRRVCKQCKARYVVTVTAVRDEFDGFFCSATMRIVSMPLFLQQSRDVFVRNPWAPEAPPLAH
jgi:hypothetical protein